MVAQHLVCESKVHSLVADIFGVLDVILTFLLRPAVPDLVSPVVDVLVEEMCEDIKRDVHAGDADKHPVAPLICRRFSPLHKELDFALT
jgi:Mor family transcriptional regulator